MPDVQHSFTDCKKELKQLCEREERAYRHTHDDVRNNPLVTVRLASEFFAVRWMAEELLRPRLRLRDFLRTKESAFYAAAVVDDNDLGTKTGDHLRAWAKNLPPEFWALNYAEMVKP
jgi:hypothetical protein